VSWFAADANIVFAGPFDAAWQACAAAENRYPEASRQRWQTATQKGWIYYEYAEYGEAAVLASVYEE
jgi:hypothetical protein